MSNTPSTYEDLILGKPVRVGLSNYEPGDIVRGKLIHRGTRDECYHVYFPNGEETYLNKNYIDDQL